VKKTKTHKPNKQTFRTPVSFRNGIYKYFFVSCKIIVYSLEIQRNKKNPPGQWVPLLLHQHSFNCFYYLALTITYIYIFSFLW